MRKILSLEQQKAGVYWNDKTICLSHESPKIQPAPKYDKRPLILLRGIHYCTNFTDFYPKMQVPFDKFRQQLPKLEKKNNMTTNSNWTKNNNKTQDEIKFIQAFSLYSWDNN